MDNITRICIVIGTRPEIIKFSPIIDQFQNRNINFSILHTGQHYSKELDSFFFKELKLPAPNFHLKYNNLEFQLGTMIKDMYNIFSKEKFDLVLVLGDTNSTLAGALASVKSKTKVAHIEAGLRSHELDLHEEINRITIDNVSDYLFTPTDYSKSNLLKEGISDNVFVTGNTIVDAVYKNMEKLDSSDSLFEDLNLEKSNYILVTSHRSQNVDNKDNLAKVLNIIKQISNETKLKAVWSIHPRTKDRIKRFNLSIPKEIIALSPLGYFDFLKLIKNSFLTLTDSGGVQEESCTLNVPCITIRESTERQETVLLGYNHIVGLNKQKASKALKIIKSKKNKIWKNPYGEGNSASNIVDIIENLLN